MIADVLKRSNYIVFGDCGPKTKTFYTVENNTKTDSIIFSDNTRVAYFDKDKYMNPLYVVVPDACSVYIKE